MKKQKITSQKTASKVRNRVAGSKKELLTALGKSSGIVSSACKAAGISRVTFYKWYNEDADFAEKVDDIKELQKDFCEALILKKMKEGDTTMIIFYAKTQMKDRGYSERKEVTGADGKPFVAMPDIDLDAFSAEQRDLLREIGEKVLNDKGH